MHYSCLILIEVYFYLKILIGYPFKGMNEEEIIHTCNQTLRLLP